MIIIIFTLFLIFSFLLLIYFNGKKYELAEIKIKNEPEGGSYIYYSFMVECDGIRKHIHVDEDVYNKFNEGDHITITI